jgi:hypothetical protein
VKIHDKGDKGLKNYIYFGLGAPMTIFNIERTNAIIVHTLDVGRGNY